MLRGRGVHQKHPYWRVGHSKWGTFKIDVTNFCVTFDSYPLSHITQIPVLSCLKPKKACTCNLDWMTPTAASSVKVPIKFQTFSKFRPFFQFVCLEKCKANSDCAWFTFYHTNNYCHLMSNCNNLEETFCQGTMESWKLFVFSFLAPTAIALKSNAKYSSYLQTKNC